MKERLIFTFTITVLLVLIFLAGCSTTKKVPESKIIHLRDIPVEVVYKGHKYKVIPKKTEGVGKEIGMTQETNFRVFILNNVDPSKQIALLVRERNPTLYYRAISN